MMQAFINYNPITMCTLPCTAAKFIYLKCLVKSKPDLRTCFAGCVRKEKLNRHILLIKEGKIKLRALHKNCELHESARKLLFNTFTGSMFTGTFFGSL